VAWLSASPYHALHRLRGAEPRVLAVNWAATRRMWFLATASEKRLDGDPRLKQIVDMIERQNKN
jgi:hypothetical protein